MVKQLKWSWFVFAITLAAGLVSVYLADPASEVPVHWNASGEVDRMASPMEAFLLIPGIQLLTLLIFAVIKKLEPRRENIENSGKAIQAVVLAVTCLMLLIQGIMIAGLFRPELIGINILFAGMGLMFAVMGNYLGKLRSSFFIGIRTPWTLSSETVWKKTHRLGGKLMVAAGLILFVLSFVLPQSYMVYALLATVMPASLGSAIYSWVLWQQEQSN